MLIHAEMNGNNWDGCEYLVMYYCGLNKIGQLLSLTNAEFGQDICKKTYRKQLRTEV